MMKDNEITKANDILEKFDFFNQRAGYELWNDKPKDVQDKDIEDKANDIKFLKDFINRQQAEIERYRKNLNTNFVLIGSRGSGKSTLERKAIEFRVDEIRKQAIKEYAERLKEKVFIQENPFEANEHKFVKLIAAEEIDNIVKEMVGEQQ